MNLLKFLPLLIIPFSAMAEGTSLSNDLHWFTETLKTSKMMVDNVQRFLSPFEGKQSFRISSKDAPWAGNYYPMNEGGIAQRWQDGSYTDKLLTQNQIKKMTSAQLRKLSPVEKFDILMGDYNFSATQRELTARGPLRNLPVQEWEGFCNGVRCAGILLDEPRYEVTMTNKDGIRLNFLPADLKALAGASYFWVEKYAQLGKPSQTGMSESQPHPVVFDLALRLHLAENKKPFVIDSHLGSEIWNETVVGYDRTVKTVPMTSQERLSYPHAVEKVSIDLRLETLGEIDIKESNNGTKAKVANGQYLDSIFLNYEMYLDSNRRPIEGKWIYNPAQGSRGVDFAWFANGKGTDSKFAADGGNPHLNFKVIQDLFKESVNPTCRKIFSF